jgi:hypothetical protein
MSVEQIILGRVLHGFEQRLSQRMAESHIQLSGDQSKNDVT